VAQVVVETLAHMLLVQLELLEQSILAVAVAVVLDRLLLLMLPVVLVVQAW
jgi:hypothetical protein